MLSWIRLETNQHGKTWIQQKIVIRDKRNLALLIGNLSHLIHLPQVLSIYFSSSIILIFSSVLYFNVHTNIKKFHLVLMPGDSFYCAPQRLELEELQDKSILIDSHPYHQTLEKNVKPIFHLVKCLNQQLHLILSQQTTLKMTYQVSMQ